MKITDLNKEEVLTQAQTTFSDKFIELDNIDLYLEDVEKGEVTIDGIDHQLFVNTHYVYEDHLVNNNKTRYKIPLTIIFIKENPYDVIYDSRGKCYVAYEDDQIRFILYEDFQVFLKPFVHEKQ